MTENLCGILCLVSVKFYEDGERSTTPFFCGRLTVLFFLTIVGYAWASTILAILATVMGIFPFLFYKFGPQIRTRSRYAKELARLEEEEHERLKFIEAQYYREHAEGQL
jgi:hypothetical protein